MMIVTNTCISTWLIFQLYIHWILLHIFANYSNKNLTWHTEWILSLDWFWSFCPIREADFILCGYSDVVLLLLYEFLEGGLQGVSLGGDACGPGLPARVTLLNHVVGDLGAAIVFWDFPGYTDALGCRGGRMEVLGWWRHIWENKSYDKDDD